MRLPRREREIAAASEARARTPAAGRESEASSACRGVESGGTAQS